jgi:hypothetical protein
MTTNDAPVSSNFGAAPPPTAPSPALAAAQLNRLTADREWGAKFMNGEPTARAEFDRLSKEIANGDATADALAGARRR